MKTKYLILLAIIFGFSSCSTAYKTGQTPDDVYYSPAPAVETEYVVLDNSDQRDIRNQMQSLRYRNNLSLSFSYGYNPYSFLNYGYSYNPYSFYTPGYGFGNSKFINPFVYGIYDPYGYSYMPYFTNPYYFYGNYAFYSPYDHRGGYRYDYFEPPIPAPRPRTSYLGTYGRNVPFNPRPQTVRGTNGNTQTATQVPVRRFTPSSTTQPAPQRTTGVGNVIRRVFTPSTERRENNPNRTFENNRRENNSRENNPTPHPMPSYTPPSTPPPSSGGSAPVRTFRKG